MRSMLFVLALIALSRPALAERCGVLFSDSGTYTEGLADANCTLRDSFNLAVGGETKTYKSYDASGSAYAGRDWHIRIAHDTLERAALVYGRLAQMPSATVIFGGGAPRTASDDGGRRRVLAETVPKIFGSTCVLSVTDATLGIGYGAPSGEEELKLTIAHELFHCVQLRNWREKMQDAMASDSAWWVEGTAEYFQHEVYPEYALAPSRAPDFDSQIGRDGLLGAAHANAVFFSYYADAAGGPSGVIGFIGRMAARPGREVQVSATAAVPDFPNLFQNFAQRYLDRDLRSPGGNVIPVNPAAGDAIRIAEPGDRDIRVKPFTVRAARFVFPIGENWMIEGPSGGDVQYRLRYEETRGDWHGAPFEVQACARERTVVLAPTAIVSPEETKTLRLRFERRRGDSTGCPCPLGNWTIQRTDIDEQFPLSQMGASLPDTESNKGWRFHFSEGSPLLQFNRDGTAWYDATLTFETDQKPVQVPAACTSDACVRSCVLGRFSGAFCGPKRETFIQWRIVDKTRMTWDWLRQDNVLLRTISGGEGQNDIYFYDGFTWRYVTTKGKKIMAGSKSGNPFRCVANELYLDPAPRGSASGMDDLIAQLERGNEQQRAAAARMREAQARTRGDPTSRDLMDRMARGEGAGAVAYPFTGRFVR